jgi:hypothetical protein
MFLSYKYIGKLEEGTVKVELYDTNKRTMLLKKVYAYQLFYNNLLVAEDEYLVPKKHIAIELADIAAQFLQLSCLPSPLQLEYMECFEVVQ